MESDGARRSGYSDLARCESCIVDFSEFRIESKCSNRVKLLFREDQSCVADLLVCQWNNDEAAR